MDHRKPGQELWQNPEDKPNWFEFNRVLVDFLLYLGFNKLDLSKATADGFIQDMSDMACRLRIQIENNTKLSDERRSAYNALLRAFNETEKCIDDFMTRARSVGTGDILFKIKKIMKLISELPKDFPPNSSDN